MLILGIKEIFFFIGKLKYIFLQYKIFIFFYSFKTRRNYEKFGNCLIFSHPMTSTLVSSSDRFFHNTVLGVKYNYLYDTNWIFFSDIKTTLFDNSISNSPIVDSKYQHNFLLGVLYVW